MIEDKIMILFQRDIIDSGIKKTCPIDVKELRPRMGSYPAPGVTMFIDLDGNVQILFNRYGKQGMVKEERHSIWKQRIKKLFR